MREMRDSILREDFYHNMKRKRSSWCEPMKRPPVARPKKAKPDPPARLGDYEFTDLRKGFPGIRQIARER